MGKETRENLKTSSIRTVPILIHVITVIILINIFWIPMINGSPGDTFENCTCKYEKKKIRLQ
jgi:hypothetical protein